LTSPCDGKVLSYGEIKTPKDLILVKGQSYDLTEFLFGTNSQKNVECLFFDNSNNKKIYQITIYLSPSDCHRVYSPNYVNVSERIYVPGYLESVSPNYLKKNKYVLSTNERVSLNCMVKESNDILFMTMVGAINIGSICINFDPKLKTRLGNKIGECQIHKFPSDCPLSFNKKEEVGWFNFGSTVVLIFSVDGEKIVNFRYKEDECVKIGQSLFDLH
jgi:phosphatidylserine decarboxylase